MFDKLAQILSGDVATVLEAAMAICCAVEAFLPVCALEAALALVQA